ncbi:putative adipose-regulatory protein-domain-containing protein [Rhexocercosporidium sp. MPI-PUGE-AT-0058]|nr:putative adipose-regulatory protein-domain-containing protein [Rhexocercosporidium sp. MPI-PUGE-AT-0058]
MDLILKPVRVATSKPARQTYLNTILFMITSSILFGLAVFAYILFYYNYVPQIGIERVIHLQYGDGPHPYGITSLDSSLVSQQAYDITLVLHVPRSPPNLQQGNFMLSLSLLSPTYKPLPSTTDASPLTPITGPTLALSKGDILFSSRRPALLTYTSRLVSLSERLLALPLYILGLKHESEILHIPMAESASFPRGRKNIPGFAMLELQAGQEVQVYAAKITFKARFGGLRWLMYNYRVISFVIFTAAFWLSEVLFTAIGWLAVRAIFATGGDVKKEVKGEEGSGNLVGVKKEGEESDELNLSDTARTFPTYGRQAPLRYESTRKDEPQVKDEDSEEYAALERGGLAEADDEDEEEEDGIGGYRGGRTDSGLGTSFSEGGERGSVKRRKSRGGKN